MLEDRKAKFQTLKAHVEAALAEDVYYTDEEVAAYLAADAEREAKIQALRAHLEAACQERGGFFDEELDEILLRGELPD